MDNFIKYDELIFFKGIELSLISFGKFILRMEFGKDASVTLDSYNDLFFSDSNGELLDYIPLHFFKMC